MGKITHGSLFSGIGGFDLAAEWAGWENLFHCEINEFGRKVLNYYWPNAISYEDITKTDFTIWRGKIDVLTGGFPCQPYSTAGKRLGKEDERHLWPEMLRVIREIQPTWVVGENVSGLINWSGGLVFDEVQADLEAIGYEVTPFLLPACAVNAPHRRDRIWFVAYKNTDEIRRGSNKWEEESNFRKFGNFSSGNNEQLPTDNEQTFSDSKFERLQRCESNNEQSKHFQFKRPGEAQIITNTNGFGLRGESYRIGNTGFFDKNCKGADWTNFPTQSPICNGDDGLSSRLSGITFSKWRNESIKACGNAIVPQVVYQIFKAINEYGENKSLHQHPDNRP